MIMKNGQVKRPKKTLEAAIKALSGYEGTKGLRPKKDRNAVCSYCTIRQDCPDSLEGEAVKLLSRDRGIRIFRTKYGKYYTAREERVAGGKEYFEHAWIDACPKCGRRLG